MAHERPDRETLLALALARVLKAGRDPGRPDRYVAEPTGGQGDATPDEQRTEAGEPPRRRGRRRPGR